MKSNCSNKKKVAQISTKKKRYNFMLDRMYFTEIFGYQKFLFFAPMLSSVTVDKNEKVSYSTSTGISSEKIKTFDTKLEPTVSNLANDRVILKFQKSVLVQ